MRDFRVFAWAVLVLFGVVGVAVAFTGCGSKKQCNFPAPFCDVVVVDDEAEEFEEDVTDDAGDATDGEEDGRDCTEVCFVPPGRLEAARTLCVPEKAADILIDLGAYEGACEDL